MVQAFDDVRWLLAQFNLLLGNARFGDQGAVGIEPVQACVFELPAIGREVGTVGKDDLRRDVVAIVLNQGHVQQCLRMLLVRRRDGDLLAPAGKRRRDGEIAIECARAREHLVFNLCHLIGRERRDELLDDERDQRHHQARR